MEAVNPNEPLYCFCQRISFGEMVGCDNEECTYGEWFHFECVNLTEAPESWYCPDCTSDMEREKKAGGRKKRSRR